GHEDPGRKQHRIDLTAGSQRIAGHESGQGEKKDSGIHALHPLNVNGQAMASRHGRTNRSGFEAELRLSLNAQETLARSGAEEIAEKQARAGAFRHEAAGPARAAADSSMLSNGPAAAACPPLLHIVPALTGRKGV